MLLGIVGHSRSGRTTLAQYLAIQFGGKICSLGDGWKGMVGSLLDQFGHFRTAGSKYKDILGVPGLTPNDLYRSVRLWGRREMGVDFWNKAWDAHFGDVESNLKIIDDISFVNEAEMVRALGGKLVRVFRPDVDFDVDLEDELECEVVHISTDVSYMNDEPSSQMAMWTKQWGALQGLTPGMPPGDWSLGSLQNQSSLSSQSNFFPVQLTINQLAQTAMMNAPLQSALQPQSTLNAFDQVLGPKLRRP
jgi:hypothetical protein